MREYGILYVDIPERVRGSVKLAPKVTFGVGLRMVGGL